MYQCVGCEGIVENINSQCLCGKTMTNRKGKVEGENFSKIPVEGFSEEKVFRKARLLACPHCDWQGMVVERFNIGCPDHGIWYKEPEEKHTVTGEEHNDREKGAGGDIKPVRGDEVRMSARARRREESRNRKERQGVRRSNRKR